MYKLCKTEQSAQRQRQMEQGLLEYMRVYRYEEITISDLCEHLQIPRKSFYRYFDSKDGALFALIDHTFMEYEGFQPPIPDGTARSMESDLESFFLFWESRKPVLDVLKKSGLSGILLERAIDHVKTMSSIVRFLPGESEHMRSYVSNFAISGIMIMMVNWHNAGYRESAKEMAQIATRLLSKPLFPDIRNLLK